MSIKQMTKVFAYFCASLVPIFWLTFCAVLMVQGFSWLVFALWLGTSVLLSYLVSHLQEL